MLCFAYGSNLSIRRLQARLASARFVAVASLAEHRLQFHKRSRVDGSAKCDAWFTGDARDRVLGMVAAIDEEEKPRLDAIEGLGVGYGEKQVTVITEGGRVLQAQMYYATDIDQQLRPFDWYRQHVLTGARELQLPREYIATIEAMPVWTDPDPQRHLRELSIYG